MKDPHALAQLNRVGILRLGKKIVRKEKIAEYVARVDAEVAKERAVHEARAARREVVA